MKKTKPRTPIISPEFEGHVEIGGFDENDGIFTFKDSNGNKVVPNSITISDSYPKQSGKPKILNTIRTENNQINLNQNDNLSNFDWLFSIDTNYKKHNESVISISCSSFFILDLKEPKLVKGIAKQDWHAKVIMQTAFIFRNPTVNPELVGWQELINRIKKNPEYRDNLKIGIVVDSELGNLNKINNHEMPIIGEHFLPANFHLIYASSDAGADYPHNKIIRICDKVANAIWKHIMENNEILNDMEDLDNLFIDGSMTLSSKIVHGFL